MAYTITVKINGYDIRAAYGLEITERPIHDMAPLQSDESRIIGRDGVIPQPGSRDKKSLKMGGWLEGTSHADALTKIDALKKDLGAGYHGRQTFMIEFADYSDRYFLARLIKIAFNPPGPAYSAATFKVELEIQIDDPDGIYNTFSFLNLIDSPFSSPTSYAYEYSGTSLCRPRILVKNVGASTAITSLRIINTAVKNTRRNIAASTSGVIARGTGRWADVNGAASFVAANSPALYYLCQNNFNPACFTIFMFLYQDGMSDGMSGYLFSTTSETIRLYETISPTPRFVFDINGNEVILLHLNSGFLYGEWWCIMAGYDGSTMHLMLYNISSGQSFISNAHAPFTYRGLPEHFFIGIDSSGNYDGNKRIDDFRLYNYRLPGLLPGVPGDFTDSYIEKLAKMTAPLPMGKGCTFYQPFDYKLDAKGRANTDLLITQSLAVGAHFEIDCESQNVIAAPAAFSAAPSSVMASVSGEFPFLLPGTNGLQFYHNGDANALQIAIEEKRRFA